MTVASELNSEISIEFTFGKIAISVKAQAKQVVDTTLQFDTV